jgi:hypothetical protein
MRADSSPIESSRPEEATGARSGPRSLSSSATEIALVQIGRLQPPVDLAEGAAAAGAVAGRHRAAVLEELEAAAPAFVRRLHAELAGDLGPGVALGPVDEHCACVIGRAERGIGEGAPAETAACLQHDGRASRCLELLGRGDTRGTGADHDHVRLGGAGRGESAGEACCQRSRTHQPSPAVEHEE